MRVELGLLFGLLLSGCAVNIGSESDGAPAASSAVPALSGCLPLADSATTLTGRVSRATLPDQRMLTLASSATVGGQESSVGFMNADSSGNSACLSGSAALPARPIVDTSALGTGDNGHPLAAVTVPTTAILNDTFLYFSADHADGLASDGTGVARWDDASQSFLALTVLWTADRPSYGSAAVLVGDEVYVFGGLAARFLSADVYLARVPIASIAEPSAYEYWQGGGNFGAGADSAQPLVEGGQSPTVMWSAARRRFLLLYATPLASDVTVRSGLGISGPWSLPVTLGRCGLPASDPSSFCGDLALTPDLAADDEIAFTQGVASFARPAQATDQDFWTRLVRTPWPSALP